MHITALSDDAVFGAVRSWDSYSWNWGPGAKGVDRPEEYLQIPGETWSSFVSRLARLYYQNTVFPQLEKSRQMTLW
jgi:hypothetical protein